MSYKVIFYEKDNELSEINFPVLLGVFKEGKCPQWKSNISDFDENKNTTTRH